MAIASSRGGDTRLGGNVGVRFHIVNFGKALQATAEGGISAFGGTGGEIGISLDREAMARARRPAGNERDPRAKAKGSLTNGDGAPLVSAPSTGRRLTAPAGPPGISSYRSRSPRAG